MRVGRLCRVAALTALVMAAPAGIAAQSGPEPLRSLSVGFEPARFYAGEKVRALVALGPGNPGIPAFSIDKGQGFGALDARPELEILGASLSSTKAGWLYSVTFIAWAPGVGTIPSLSIGGLRFPAIEYAAIATTGADDRVPGPRRPQVDPPGAALYLYASLALLAVIALLTLAFVYWILPGARALLVAWRSREAFRLLSRTLDWLDANVEGPEREWYALLSRSLRIYVARRLIPEAEALTPAEIAALPPAGLPENGFKEGLSALLGESDQIRYAGRNAGTTARARATRQARDLAGLVEGWEEVATKAGADART
ncbi:MAG TPA: hypothetical protein VMV83_11795 [Rectinemataceae bacterium]|nr:hypothetical protein [Rectinemataceae bacterium]